MNRLQTLQEFVAKNPSDPFPLYGLAMEHKNLGQLEQASELFARLIAQHPHYTAAYLHAGNTLVALGKQGEARQVFEAGIEACRKRGDQHALSELAAALGAL
jgi:tetratricopeptide (TPR) repeat protein